MNIKAKITTLGVAAGFLLNLAVLPSPAADTRTTPRHMPPQRGLGRVEKADEVIGSEIKNTQGQTLGKIDDLVVDLESGHVLYALVSANGNDVAVAPESFTASQGNRIFTLNADNQKLASAPKANKDQAVEMANADFLNTVYQYWNQSPWWQGAAQPTGRNNFGNVHKLSELKGMAVKNTSNQDIGKVDNVAVDLPAGRLAFVLLAPGGTLQSSVDFVYALPPNAFTLGSENKSLVTDLDQKRLASAPKINRNNLQALSNTAFATRVYQYYGKQAYFGAAANTGGAASQSQTPTAIAGGAAASGFGQMEPAHNLIGREIRDQQNQVLGKLQDVILDLESGRVIYAVALVDGHPVGVAPEIFSQTAPGKPLTVNVDRQKLSGAPAFTSDISNNLASANFASDVYHYFNQPAWWEGAGQATGRSFGNIRKASDLTGADVKDASNQELGKVQNVLIDLPDGRVSFVILSAQGAAGAGQALYAIPPNAFTPGQDPKTLTTGLDRQKLQSAPRLAANNLKQLSDPGFAAQIYEFYGKQPYWNTSPTGRTGSGGTTH